MKSSIPSDQNKQLEELKDTQETLKEQWVDYWFDYSSIDTWQFWVNAGMLIIPLIFLYFFIDRKKIFLLGFLGFNIHIWTVYLDAFATSHNYLEYPYKAIPFLPVNFGVDTSLVPVLFIFVYQWALRNKKNYYLYFLLLISFVSFIFRPLTSAHHLLHLKQGANYLHIFFGYILVTLFSLAITNLFLYLHKKDREADS